MPLYEYKCTKCNGYFEKLQKFSDPSPAQCEICQETGGIERLLSTPVFHLKGGGWYKDGYASSAPPAASSKPETSTSSESKASTPAKTESKPAAPAPASTSSST